MRRAGLVDDGAGWSVIGDGKTSSRGGGKGKMSAIGRRSAVKSAAPRQGA
jgi:hypothetical protein